MKSLNTKAFTLVELIVSVTILIILGTIAFLSYQGYTKQARDSIRVTDVQNIEKSLALFEISKGIYPEPENSISLLASGATIGHQGEVSGDLFRTLEISKDPKDPLNDSYYTYSTNSKNRLYTLAGFMEGGKNMIKLNETEQSDPIYLLLKGNSWGTVYSPQYDEVNKISSIATQGSLELFQQTDVYNIVFTNDKILSGTGDVIGVMAPLATSSRPEFTLDSIFNENLVGYWDMETLNNEGKVFDISTNAHHGTIVGTPQSVSGLIGKAYEFNGVDSYVSIAQDGVLDIAHDLTVVAWVKTSLDLTTSDRRKEFLARRGVSIAFGFEKDVVDDIDWLRMYIKDSDNVSTSEVELRDNEKQLRDNTGRLIVGTFKPAEFQKLYVNGSLVDTDLPAGGMDVDELKISTTDKYYGIGARPLSGGTFDRFFPGTIDEVQIYNKVLSDEEVTQLYNSMR